MTEKNILKIGQKVIQVPCSKIAEGSRLSCLNGWVGTVVRIKEPTRFIPQKTIGVDFGRKFPLGHRCGTLPEPTGRYFYSDELIPVPDFTPDKEYEDLYL